MCEQRPREKLVVKSSISRQNIRRLVTCEIPNCLSRFAGCDENAVAISWRWRPRHRGFFLNAISRWAKRSCGKDCFGGTSKPNARRVRYPDRSAASRHLCINAQRVQIRHAFEDAQGKPTNRFASVGSVDIWFCRNPARRLRARRNIFRKQTRSFHPGDAKWPDDF